MTGDFSKPNSPLVETPETPAVSSAETAPPQTPPPASSPPQEAKRSSKPLLWIVGAVIVVAVGAGALLFWQQGQKQAAKPQFTIRPVRTASPAATPSGGAAESKFGVSKPDDQIPAISDKTDLETLEKELGELEVGSPESDLAGLDQDASQL